MTWELGETPGAIPELLARTAVRRGPEPALGTIVDGKLNWLTWSELAARVDAWRTVLCEQLGVAPGDRVAQVSSNCLEWVLTDLSVLAAGAVHVPLHASLAAVQAAEHIGHCEARLVLVREAELAASLAGQVTTGVAVVRHQEMRNLAERQERGADAAAGRSQPDPAGRAAEGDALATILYTSGTTGTPLGVMLSHRNLVSNAIGITEAAAPSGDEVRFGLLPLSHIYARTCDLYSWLVYGGRLVLAESRETAFRDLGVAEPTAINAVPYFYQKVVDRLRESGGQLDAERLRRVLGGKIRRCYCGGAALPPDLDHFFAERGLPILCGYGLTETSPVVTATTPDGYRPGTVGPPLTAVEVRLADDGEVLVRGPNVMLGYWGDQAATSRAIRDGWLATGDTGDFDAAGHLRIVGRKKELIVLSTGKNVSPTQVEVLLSGSPWIEQACVVGDGRKCLAALVVPNGEALRREIKRRRLWVWSKRRAVTHPQVVALYREEIDRCLNGRADFEQVVEFTLLDRAFSQSLGEVTPKLSLRRAAIEQGFAREIEAMYQRARRSPR